MHGERLVAVGVQCRRTLDDDKAVIQRVVATVAAGGELVERGGKCSMILGLDYLLERGNLGADGLLHGVATEQLVHIVEAFVQFADLVLGERPVAGATGEPELAVAHLLQRHDLAEAGLARCLRRRGLLGLFGLILCVRRRRREHRRRDQGCKDRLHELILY